MPKFKAYEIVAPPLLVLLMSHLRFSVRVLRNTIPKSTVICHIQIKVIRVLHEVLSCCQKEVIWWGGGGGVRIVLQPSSFCS